MGTEIDTFTGTDRMTSVVPGISSLKNERYLLSILLNAPWPVATVTVRLTGY